MLFAVIKNHQESLLEEKLVNGIEIRVDCLQSLAVCKDLFYKSSLPVLFTLRKKSQGGLFKGSEKERLELIEELFSLHPTFFDLEHDTDRAFIERMHTLYPDVKIICSYHNFIDTPKDLSSLFASMRSTAFYGYKIATTALSTLDALRMLLLVKKIREKGEKITGITMGEKGQVSRILGPIFGNFLTYAPVHHSELGQITIQDLYSLYNYKNLNSKTTIYGLIGSPIDQSIGHYAHNAVMKAFGLESVYVKMLVEKNELSEFFTLAKVLGIAGLSVTMPLKELVLPFLDEISPEVKKIGSVNTISFENGKSYGFNTDGEGAVTSIKQKISLEGKKVIILGAGGSAKAIAHIARDNGSTVVILNRDVEKAEALAKAVKGSFGSLDEIQKYFSQGYDVLINCTPHNLPIDPMYILPEALIMDINIHPENCSLLFAAKEKGARVVFGYEMFINQAALQDILWFKKKLPQDVLSDILTATVISHITY